MAQWPSVLVAASILASVTPVVRADPIRADVGSTAFQLRLGGFFPHGGGGFWEGNGEQFSLEASDFDSAAFGMSLVHSVNRSVELGVNVDFFDQTVTSGYRDYVDGTGFPILHDTRLSVVPLTVDLRFVPGGRYKVGRDGRLTPKPAFYLGAGGGVNYWKYEEAGDFIDFGNGEIFTTRFVDRDAALEAHVLAGLSLPLSPSVEFMLEGRYSMSDDQLSGDFAGLGTLDLGGTSAYGGLSFRF